MRCSFPGKMKWLLTSGKIVNGAGFGSFSCDGSISEVGV